MVSVNQVVCTDSLDPVSHAVFSFFFSFLTLWHAGSWFLDRGSNPCLLQVAVWSQPLDLSGPCLSVLGMTRPFQVPKCPPRPLAKRPVGLSKNNSLQSAVLTLSCTLTQCKNRKEGWERAETILLIVLSLFRFWCLSQTCCELGFWSRGPEALRPSPRCSPREICALRKTSVLAGFSGFSRNLQLVMNYDWLWLLSPDVCVASQPLVWLLSDYSFLQGLHLKHWDLRLYLQWKLVLLFQCPRHLASDSLLLLWTLIKIETVSSTWLPLSRSYVGVHLPFVLPALTEWAVCPVSSSQHTRGLCSRGTAPGESRPACRELTNTSHSESPDRSVTENNLLFFDHFPQLSGEVVVFLPMTLHNYFFH